MSKLELTPEAVAEIVSILDGSGYDKLDITTDAFRLRIQKAGGESSSGWTQDWELAERGSPEAITPGAAEQALPDGLLAITAPLPGSFFHAPQPGAPPFVEIGDIVTRDTVVGIIETMKLMNPVHAGCDGVIEAILLANGQMVDGGMALMHVRAG